MHELGVRMYRQRMKVLAGRSQDLTDLGYLIQGLQASSGRTGR
jgi:hypothetical protein